MRLRLLLPLTTLLLAVSACERPTELASEANAKGRVSAPAAAANTAAPEIPADLLAEAPPAEPPPVDGAAPYPGYTPLDRPVTVTDFRAGVAGDIGALPPVGDAAALAAAFANWKARAAAAPGAFADGAVQLGADPQEYNPSDAELVAAEAGDRLAAALRGADETTKAAVAAALGDAPDAKSYRRFDYRNVDVMGSGRYFYASPPKDASLPL